MKRILLFAIAIAVLIAGCGSGGSTTPVASTPKTTTAKKAPKKHKKPHKAHKKKKKVIKKKKIVHHHTSTSSSSGGSAVTTTTTAVTTTAVTTTTSAPPPPPTTTHTTTHSAPPPVTTHQTTTHHHHHHSGGGSHGGGYCLSVTDRIATPSGSVLVADVRPGMQVWSTNTQGRRISVKVLRVHHTAVPANHMMVRLRLADGRTVLVSLGHPLPDGAAVRTLAAGERFEGARVVSAARVRYGRPYTYDILPAGSTHTYYADGVLLGSTLAPPGTYLARPF